MPVTRRNFVEYCLTCGGVLTLPGCYRHVLSTLCKLPAPPPPKSTDSMNVMEHPKDVIFSPPLIDEQVLLRFSRAVRLYAQTKGLQPAPVMSALNGVSDRLNYFVDLASSCRFAILGESKAFSRVLEQMRCISKDYPHESLDEEARLEYGTNEPDPRVQLAAAIDLFAGAAFVSKDNSEQLRRFVLSLSRAIQSAVALPLSFSSEAAMYLGEGKKDMPPIDATIAVETAMQRLLDGSCSCKLEAPIRVRMRIAALARDWLRANPVSAFFEALTGPRLRECPTGISPRKVQVGDLITLEVPYRCLGFGGKGHGSERDAARSSPKDLVVMFCPHQPATIEKYVEGGIQVRVPPFAQSGPIALCRRPPKEELDEVTCLWQRFQNSYPAEWMLSALTMIPPNSWAYPTAFLTSKWIEITEVAPVPQIAKVAIFDSSGRRAEDKLFKLGDAVTVHFRVEPEGSDKTVALRIQTSGGRVIRTRRSDELIFRPTVRGRSFVRLIWGSCSAQVPIHTA